MTSLNSRRSNPLKFIFITLVIFGLCLPFIPQKLYSEIVVSNVFQEHSRHLRDPKNDAKRISNCISNKFKTFKIVEQKEFTFKGME